MSAGAITRRSLLAAGAGAIASGLTRPAGALAVLAYPPRPSLSEQWVGRLPPGGRTIELARAADLIGVQWRSPAGVGIEMRFRGDAGSWSGWVSAIGCAGGHAHGSDGHSATNALEGDPVWTGGTTVVQLRATGPLNGVRLALVDVSGGIGARRQSMMLGSLAAALPRATPVLAAGPGQPPIIARRAWAQGVARPRVVPGYGAVRMAFVHHTQNPNGYARGEVPAMLRAIYAFHRYVNGWNDIGYNFVIDSFGRIFEARAGGIDEPVVGAQAGGYNLASTGVAVLGSFTSAPISPAARSALQRLLAWKLALHGVPAEGRVTVRVNPAGARYSRFPANASVPLPRIAGHRDGDSTDCPGNTLYGELPGIRQGVRRLAGRPARATLALAPATPPSPSPPPSSGAPPEASAPPPPSGEAATGARTLVGTLQFLDGAPIAGARIAVQGRAVSRRGELVLERTLGEALTDGEGRWSLPVSVAPAAAGTSLRALWAGSSAPNGSGGSGATISEPLDVSAAVSVSPPAPAAAPPPSPPAAGPPAT
jgi:N-acetylmuramoyl-L-alanine amidase